MSRYSYNDGEEACRKKKPWLPSTRKRWLRLVQQPCQKCISCFLLRLFKRWRISPVLGSCMPLFSSRCVCVIWPFCPESLTQRFPPSCTSFVSGPLSIYIVTLT